MCILMVEITLRKAVNALKVQCTSYLVHIVFNNVHCGPNVRRNFQLQQIQVHYLYLINDQLLNYHCISWNYFASIKKYFTSSKNKSQQNDALLRFIIDKYEKFASRTNTVNMSDNLLLFCFISIYLQWMLISMKCQTAQLTICIGFSQKTVVFETKTKNTV